jgi:arginine decarboxylase
MPTWSPDQARKTYSIPHWSEGYFDVDGGGRVVVRPRGDAGPAIALPEVVDAARASGAKLPLLVRFPDILGDRLRRLQAAFARAQAE